MVDPGNGSFALGVFHFEGRREQISIFAAVQSVGPEETALPGDRRLDHSSLFTDAPDNARSGLL